MNPLEDFEKELQDALNHLYDPSSAPAVERLAGALGLADRAGSDLRSAVQTALIEAIEAIKPPEGTPPSARSWRFYHLLKSRYMQRMTQDETAEFLAITPRHLRREQSLAVEALAHWIWEQRHHRQAAPAAPSSPELEDYTSQVKADVNAFLQRSSSEQTAPVGDVVRRAAGLVEALAQRYHLTVDIGEIPNGLIANLPGAVLRQVLVQSISELARRMNGGALELDAYQESEQVRVVLNGIPATPLAETEPVQDHLIRELLAAYNAALETRSSPTEITFEILLPANQLTVLVVDDNADLVHFYRRYVQGTRYRIEAIHEGSRIFEVITNLRPDLIVLDAMLPNVDGWELLSHLHAHPNTQHIPVVICSVVREEELALILGAAVYIAKPVRRQEFLQALDQAAQKIAPS